MKIHLVDSPDDTSLRLLLGRVHLAAGDGAAAFSAFDRARALGATGLEVREGLAESLLLEGKFSDVVDLLSVSADGSELPPSLLELRIRARLRVPLANPGELFLDARHLLAADTGNGPTELEELASADGTIPGNASHLRRALAYWTCQKAPTDGSSGELYEPAWASRYETGRRILSVGPGHELKTPGAAARIATDGDIIEIQAGAYPGDVAAWQAGGLWIRAVGGKVILDSGGATAENMGIWIIRGANTLIEGIRFEGARSTHKNGSGIRLIAPNLWVRHSEFHDNEDGILSYNRPGGEVIVEHSIFTENGAGDGYSHNVYIGGTDRLVFRFNYSAGVRIGHQLKSRAMENYILYNRLSDEASGNSSYTIDLPEGGFALVMGNELQQGPLTVNKHMISLGAEKPEGRDHRFIFAYNTFYNHSSPATFIKDATRAGVALINNAFAGAPAALEMASTARVGNAFAATGDLVDPRQADYRLKPSAPFIDTGDLMDELDGVSLEPKYEYVHPAGARPREEIWRRDPGAHEFCGWPEFPTS
ncbi:MAG TPA: right-handed parallel beta-helix repeat-containing protein [Woeseiaceae bacterium]|nr:right-handed parallel beta-helix repeat-containing protein [Woeseiaceae bacterium]